MASEVRTLFPEYLSVQDDEQPSGLLPSQKLVQLVERGYIQASEAIGANQIQPSSIDLRLGRVAYRVAASFLPGAQSTISSKLKRVLLEEIDLSDSAVLRRNNIYIVPLMEELRLPHSLWGKANPKSTTGRLDVFTRLLCDYADEFEYAPPGFKGSLYVEIVPRTFDVIVRPGTRLNQIRLVQGKPIPPTESKLSALHADGGLVYSEDEVLIAIISKKSLWLSLDLKGTHGSEIVGYRARRNTAPIDLARVNHYKPADYWEAIRRPQNLAIVLEADEFYILASRERVRIPAEYAAEMVPFDPSVGEFRIHYAGFFDPGFGCRSDDERGTHAVLEVRSHGIPFLVEDGQKVGRLLFERMLSVPAKLYGREIGSSYQFQGLALSKQFKPWQE